MQEKIGAQVERPRVFANSLRYAGGEMTFFFVLDPSSFESRSRLFAACVRCEEKECAPPAVGGGRNCNVTVQMAKNEFLPNPRPRHVEREIFRVSDWPTHHEPEGALPPRKVEDARSQPRGFHAPAAGAIVHMCFLV